MKSIDTKSHEVFTVLLVFSFLCWLWCLFQGLPPLAPSLMTLAASDSSWSSEPCSGTDPLGPCTHFLIARTLSCRGQTDSLCIQPLSIHLLNIDLLTQAPPTICHTQNMMNKASVHGAWEHWVIVCRIVGVCYWVTFATSIERKWK